TPGVGLGGQGGALSRPDRGGPAGGRPVRGRVRAESGGGAARGGRVARPAPHSAKKPGIGTTPDTRALLAPTRGRGGRGGMWGRHRRLLEQRARPVVPSVVLAQAWRGGPQHRLARLLASC